MSKSRISIPPYLLVPLPQYLAYWGRSRVQKLEAGVAITGVLLS